MITSAVIVNAGQSYSVGDILTPALAYSCTGVGYPFRLHVDATVGGFVSAVSLIQDNGIIPPIPANPISFGGGTGFGFTANCTFQ
jgi:hypothetical protein